MFFCDHESGPKSEWEFTKLLRQIRNIFCNFKVLLPSTYSEKICNLRFIKSPLIISGSKSTLSLNNLKILGPKVTKKSYKFAKEVLWIPTQFFSEECVIRLVSLTSECRCDAERKILQKRNSRCVIMGQFHQHSMSS